LPLFERDDERLICFNRFVENPAKPVAPENSVKPVVPEKSAKPVAPENSVKPVVPEKSAKPVAPKARSAAPKTGRAEGRQQRLLRSMVGMGGKPLDSTLTIDAAIHDAVMALPPDETV